MINDENQKQKAGDHSTNLQAKELTIINGLTYAEAREVALDIYNSNFIRLSEKAAEIATGRVTSFTDRFLTLLYEHTENASEEFENPALQSALYSAQKEYAKTGEEHLYETLCDLLLKRTQEKERSIRQIALEEAINIAPKLTPKQLDILTLNFLAQDGHYYINTPIGLAGYIDWLIPFIVEIDFQSPEISHLEFTGCAKIPSDSYGSDFPRNILISYPGMFTNGFTIHQYTQKLGDEEKFKKLIKEHETNKGMVRLKFDTMQGLKTINNPNLYTKEEKRNISGFLRKGTLTTNELKEKFLEIDPRTEPLFKTGINDIYRLESTPVGTAIALSNFKRKTGMTLHWPYRLRDQDT